ncbi:hypothetical protein TYRP_021520 [Tyrophagus putrescentiae]|nr:hypothetical protein TYRP_021520 [Tyrophagus putrescentiae]
MSSLTSASPLAVLDHFPSAESISSSTYNPHHHHHHHNHLNHHLNHHNSFTPGGVCEPMKGCGASATAVSTRALRTKSIVFMPNLTFPPLIIDTHSSSSSPPNFTLVQQSNSAPTSPTRKSSPSLSSSSASFSSTTSIYDPSEADCRVVMFDPGNTSTVNSMPLVIHLD